MEFLTPTLWLMKALHILALQPLALIFSALGSEPFYLLLLPLVFWFYDRKIGAQLGVLVLISVFVNDLAKLAVHLPRPYWVAPSLTPHFSMALEHTFGFPSGHSQGAFLVWPFLALRSKNPRKWLPFALGLATLIALSRMVLGVHWPLDVGGGALIGATLLLLNERCGTAIERAIRTRIVAVQLVFAAAFVAVLAGLGAMFLTHAIHDLGANARGLESGASSIVGRSAALLGLLVGLIFAPRDVPIRPSVVRGAIGFAGLALFYFGLSKVSHLFPKESPPYLLVAFVRYFLTTFWVACGALWVFRGVKQKAVVRR